MYRVIITGSRAFKDHDKLVEVLSTIYKERGPFVLVNGRAKDGADQLAHEIFEFQDMFDIEFKEESHFADWKPVGRGNKVDRGAGIKRNHRMVDLGADEVIAFPTICEGFKKNCPIVIHYSHGTTDCIEYARKRGLSVSVYGPGLDVVVEED